MKRNGKRKLHLVDSHPELVPTIVKVLSGAPVESLLTYSKEMVRWSCGTTHQWDTTVFARTRHTSKCHVCTGTLPEPGVDDLGTLRPDLSLMYSQNNVKPITMYRPGSGATVLWIGECNHEWSRIIRLATENNDCKYCSDLGVLLDFNDLRTRHPELYAEVVKTVDGDDILTYTCGSIRRVVWQCEHKHPTWETSLQQRTRYGSGCPYCAGHRAIPGETDFPTTNPEMM